MALGRRGGLWCEGLLHLAAEAHRVARLRQHGRREGDRCYRSRPITPVPPMENTGPLPSQGDHWRAMAVGASQARRRVAYALQTEGGRPGCMAVNRQFREI